MTNQYFKNFYKMTEEVINEKVRDYIKGVFVLGISNRDNKFIPLFLYRSEQDLKKDLLRKLKNNFEYFWFEKSKNIKESYILECKLFHDYFNKEGQYHPRKPIDTEFICPFCDQFPELKNFLNYYRKTIEFCTESFTEHEDDVENITEKTFYKELYQHRGIEPIIIEQIIFNPNKTIAFIGPRGCGKSTTGKRTIEIFKEGKKCLPIFINTKAEFGKVEFDNFDSNSKATTRDFIRRKILSYYRNYIEKECLQNQIYDCIIRPNKRVDINGNGAFTIFKEEYDYLFNNYCKNKSDNIEFDWIGSEDAKLLEYLNRIDNKLDVHHFCYIFKYSLFYDYQIVWLDNVDALPHVLQYYLLDSFNEIQASITPPILVFIISIREENVYRFEDFDDEEGNPDLSIVYSKDNSDKIIPDSSRIIKAVNQRVADGKVLNKIISDRLKYAQYNHIPNLKRKKLNIIDFEKYFKVIDETFYKEIVLKISEIIVKVMEITNTIYIANNSIKRYLTLHHGFFEYLLSKDEFSELSDYYSKGCFALNISFPQMVTEYYKWLTDPSKKSGLNMFNIVNHINEINADNNKISCYLPFLCLSTIWNYTLNSVERNEDVNIYHNPNIRKIIETLSIIGYKDKKVILNCLFDLYSMKSKSTESFISIRSNRIIREEDDIKEDLLVRLTYRGKVIISSVVNSYGYLLDCTSRSLHNFKQNKPDIHEYLYSYLCTLAKSHLTTLNVLGENTYFNSKGWVENYLKIFGIPQIYPYKRKENIGFMILGRYRAFYLQTVFASLLGHLKSKSDSNSDVLDFIFKVEELEKIFNRNINLLNDGKKLNIIDISDEIGIINYHK